MYTYIRISTFYNLLSTIDIMVLKFQFLTASLRDWSFSSDMALYFNFIRYIYISMYSLYDMLHDAIEYKICFGYWFQTNRSVQNSGNYCLFFLFNQYLRYNMVKNQTFCKTFIAMNVAF